MKPKRRTRTPEASGFNFTETMRLLCADMARRLPELKHIDVRRVAFSFSQVRKRVPHGLHATLTPMRFADGAMTARRHGRRYAFQRLYDRGGREMLYILNFYLPRFLDVDFDEKLTTILHELWHISPDFNGDLRRHSGRCYAHSRSQAVYDAQMARLARRYLNLSPPENLHGFLRCDFAQLQRRCGGVFGTRIAHPRLIPLDELGRFALTEA